MAHDDMMMKHNRSEKVQDLLDRGKLNSTPAEVVGSHVDGDLKKPSKSPKVNE